MIDIGKRIYEARKYKGITQSELAEKVGYTSAMIYRYENDITEPKFFTIQLIADALEVSLDDLLFGEFPAIAGERLKRLRKERNISAKRLADYLGVNENTVYSWECGQKHLNKKRIDEIAFFFGVTPKYMTEGTM